DIKPSPLAKRATRIRKRATADCDHFLAKRLTEGDSPEKNFSTGRETIKKFGSVSMDPYSCLGIHWSDSSGIWVCNAHAAKRSTVTGAEITKGINEIFKKCRQGKGNMTSGAHIIKNGMVVVVGKNTCPRAPPRWNFKDFEAISG
ncbi:hypothetical protein ACJ73_06015, partial [Blastomyces percursus]